MNTLAKNSFNLFYTLKLDTSYIIKNNKFVGFSFQEAKKANQVVSLGDNQIFDFIRQIQKIDYEKLIELTHILIKDRNTLKKLENSKENSKNIGILQNKINNLMFMPHIVSVKCDSSKKDYKEVCKHGFRIKTEVGGVIHDLNYKRLCAGAGQLRRNTALFVNTELYDELEKRMMCGLDKKKIGKINLAKFSAYYALYSSSTNVVTMPRICVVTDFKHVLEKEKISWIYDTDSGKDIEVREVDVEINGFDGSGMILPKFAETWGEDLGIDYLPTSFIIRSAWIKGLVSVFDFVKFGKEIAKKEFIVDAWGNKQYINDIDIILTTSQFKMWKKYRSWEEYCGYHAKFGHNFGVTRVNKKVDNMYTPMNYQYVQSNNFTTDSVKSLANYTLDWINKIMQNEILYTSLFLLGVQEENKNINSTENELGTHISKCLMYNKEILKDNYVKMKINQTIQNKVNQLKIGKALVEGSYDFAIPDLYAMSEHAFGMPVKGLLGRKESWCRRWVEKGSSQVALMRSPLVSPAENQLTNIVNSEKCMDWFRYIQSGIMINVWDTTMNRCSDADFDGDLLLTTDNKNVLEAVNDEAYPIMYDKTTSKEQYINPNSFASMDTKSFNSKIGFITNLASTFIAMKFNFKKESAEYKELDKRVNLLRYYQGSAIDATKGDIFIPPPKFWSSGQSHLVVEDGMTDIEKENILKENKKISFENSICAYKNKKPYFFGYVYENDMKEYKSYKGEYNKVAQTELGLSISALVKKENKTKKEYGFLNRYYYSAPLMKNKCLMNNLTTYVEGIEFENKWKRKEEYFDYNMLKSNNKNTLTLKEKMKIKECFYILIKKFNRQLMFIESIENDHIEREEILRNIIDDFDVSVFDICSNREVIIDYLIDLAYTDLKEKSNKVLWALAGDQILLNIKSNAEIISLPMEDINGVEYLGKKYSMKEIEL